MAAHQAPLSVGFSRQEYWNGFPFPSPMQESEKWKWSCSVVSNSSRAHGLCSLPDSSIHGIFQARVLEWVAISFSDAWKWKVKMKLLSRAQLSDPMDCSPPGSSIHRIFQARVLEWVAIAFSIYYCQMLWNLMRQVKIMFHKLILLKMLSLHL